MNSFPDDSDGQAIARLVAAGSDLTRPMFVDFAVAAKSIESAQSVAKAAERLGYHVKYSRDEDSNATKESWTVTCSTRLVVTHSAVVSIQDELAEIARPLDSYPDGWGTFGNVAGIV